MLAEQHGEWQVGRRYFSVDSLAKLIDSAGHEEPEPALPAAG